MAEIFIDHTHEADGSSPMGFFHSVLGHGSIFQDILDEPIMEGFTRDVIRVRFVTPDMIETMVDFPLNSGFPHVDSALQNKDDAYSLIERAAEVALEA